MNDSEFYDNLTVLEIDVLRACYQNEYHNEDDKPHVWSFSVTDNCYNCTASQVSGVVASLVKKGVVKCQGSGSEKTITVVSNAAHRFAVNKGWH
jgi:DNA-binding MarR family transcriptional regulator